jgi:hypothetical protein
MFFTNGIKPKGDTQLPAYPLLPDNDSNFEEDHVGSIHLYADLITKKLLDKWWEYHAGNQPPGRRGVHTDPLMCIQLFGMKRNNAKRKAYQRCCHVCRFHGDAHNTQWVCRE